MSFEGGWGRGFGPQRRSRALHRQHLHPKLRAFRGAIATDHGYVTIADPSNFTANQADDGSANVLVNGSNLNATTNICAASSWTANTPGLGLQNGGAVHNGKRTWKSR